MKNNNFLNILCILIIIGLYGYFEYYKDNNVNQNTEIFYASSIPDYADKDVIIINNNEPEFDEKDINDVSFEKYGELDTLGRCTYAYANIGEDLMPTKDRERISNIKPTGWHYIKYDFIDDELLYNRCHLIAYQFTAENDNKNNLITCTRHTNYDLMREYENLVGNYIRKTHNHVLYRVTPIFDEDNLLAKGVQMEALSVEDNGEGIKFNIFVYNVEPGIVINYKTGESKEK